MSRFLSYIHNLRGLAILYVVCVHVRGYDSNWLSYPQVNNFLDTFFDPSEGNGTLLFLFIGGFLFQHITHERFVYKKYLEQKFKVIVLPYLIISIPLIILRLNTNFESLSLPENFNDRSLLYQFFYYLVTGAHLAPFWFITSIVLIYFTAPLLQLCNNDRFYKYVFPFILATCLFTYRPLHNANPLLSYLHFLPVYMLGMFTSFYREKIVALGRTFTFALIAAYIGLCLLEITGITQFSRDISFETVLAEGSLVFNIYMLKGLVLCYMLMMIFYEMRNRPMPVLELLGHYSFGIFFVHYLILSFSRKALESYYGPVDFTVTSYLVYLVVILSISTATVYIFKKVTGQYSRYIIGS